MPFALRICPILLSLLLLLRPAKAQNAPVLHPNRTAGLQALLELTRHRYNQDVKSITGPHKKYEAQIYKERFEFIRKKIEEEEILTDSSAGTYLQSLAGEIIRANPQLGALGARVLFSRSYWPNAVSMGEGTILFNIGLFHKLRNESQAAFVLSHELAHLYLDHGNKGIRSYVTTLYSDEFQKKLRTIQKSDYGRNGQLESLTRDFAFNSRRHSRASEGEADSLALVFLKNTPFEPAEALSCLALLDSADTDKYNHELRLDQVFHFPAYPFKKRWLEKDDLLFLPGEAGDKQKAAEQDSLKTHPDCATRIERLRPAAAGAARTGKRENVVNEVLFHQLKRAFDREILEYCYASGQVARGLYFALQLLQHYPDSAGYHAYVGKCLNRIYTAQKNHELNKIVELPDPRNKERYNTLLHFLQNLRLNEMAALSNYFLSAGTEKFGDNEEFIAALITSKDHFGLPEEKKLWVTYYKKFFPNGKYSF